MGGKNFIASVEGAEHMLNSTDTWRHDDPHCATFVLVAPDPQTCSMIVLHFHPQVLCNHFTCDGVLIISLGCGGAGKQ